MEGFTLGSLLASIIGSALFLLLYGAISRLVRKLLVGKKWLSLRIRLFKISTSFWPRHAAIAITSLTLVWTFEIFAVYLGVQFDPYAKFLVPMISVLMHSMRRELQHYRLGFARPEAKVTSGTDYRRSLALCSSRLDFLGTAGAKLIELDEFEEVLKRCARSSSSNVRLLLLKPDVATLRRAEKRANAIPSSYSGLVRKSLAKLKRLKEERELEALVRFYHPQKEDPTQPFRMMFIDDRVLLLSFNVYGEGDGRQQPQEVIHNGRSVQGRMTFYRPFHDYFEALWQEAEPWDYASYVEPEATSRLRPEGGPGNAGRSQGTSATVRS